MLPLNHRAANDRSPPNVSNVVMPIWRSSVGARHALVNVWSTRECDSANISIRCRPSKSGHSRRKLCAFKGLSSKSLKRKSIEIRRSAAHNLKVVGSNPTPATKKIKLLQLDYRLTPRQTAGLIAVQSRGTTRGNALLRAIPEGAADREMLIRQEWCHLEGRLLQQSVRDHFKDLQSAAAETGRSGPAAG